MTEYHALADKLTTVENPESKLNAINSELRRISEILDDMNVGLGKAEQTIRDIEKLKDEIAEVKAQITSTSLTVTRYEVLKVAFGQDGVPHQIIRNVIPYITQTANNILGSMTGGKMGVEFVLDKVTKGKDGEKATLDVLIEEYGKTRLPYASKSGGEKVKASLAVILALAEVKTGSSGVQLGMLSIDEPPFLDSEGTEAYVDALEAIRDRYPNVKVMAISHDENFKARFSQSVTVIKTDDGLNMRADDDGFIGNPKRVMRTIGASDDDLRVLIAKRFVIQFEDGVIVIKHWRMHNTLRGDRYTRTVYTDELQRLDIKDNKAYTLVDKPELATIGCQSGSQSGNQMATRWQPSGTADKDIDIDKDIGIDKTIDLDKNTCATEPYKKAQETKESHELFEYLWTLYPKKRGKGSVSDTQKKKLLKVGKDDMEQAIRNYLEEINNRGTDMKYVKNGSSFFNSGYIDYLPENYTPLPAMRRADSRYQSTAEYMAATAGWSDGIDD